MFKPLLSLTQPQLQLGRRSLYFTWETGNGLGHTWSKPIGQFCRKWLVNLKVHVSILRTLWTTNLKFTVLCFTWRILQA